MSEYITTGNINNLILNIFTDSDNGGKPEVVYY